jgi:hypothetical protein
LTVSTAAELGARHVVAAGRRGEESGSYRFASAWNLDVDVQLAYRKSVRLVRGTNFLATTCTTCVGFSASALELPSEPAITIAMTARIETLGLIALPHHNLTGHPRV